ncbi:UBX domain protein Ubx2 [Coemansia sp. RSA 1199]|nr:UBX domain protein Ubx2 [Coemansia sp. RSA 1199]
MSEKISKKTPTDFLKHILGQQVFVRLNSGVDYKGVLSCLDGYMNIALEQTEEYVDGELRNRYGDAFIRGNNVTESNVEQAVSLYFENGGQPLQSHGAATAAAAAPASGRSTPGLDDSDVRAPIAARRDVLVDGYGSSMGDVYQSAYGAYVPNALRSSTASIFNQNVGAGQVPFRDFAQEAAEIANEPAVAAAASRRSRLAELFKPPFDIMFTGGLDSAKQTALASGKWVLVNLQNVSDFRCQALNRDIWSQGIIKDIVRKNFCFLQLSVDVPEGSRIANMYNASSYPLIAVIHPKTGELRTLFDRYENVADMLEDMTHFMSENPLAKKNGGSNEASTSRSASTGGSALGNVYNLSEEDQLAAAIAASELDGQVEPAVAVGSGSEYDTFSDANSYSDIHSISSSDGDYSEDEMDVDDVSAAHEQMAQEATSEAVPEEQGPGAWYRDLPGTEPLEPAAGPASTRIQFRFPNGQRVVKRFAKTDSVATIFQYLKATLPEAASEIPEVLFMSTRLSDCVDQTIEEAKLVNASIVVDI